MKSPTDKFSWLRIARLYEFYRPSLMRYWFWTAVLTIICYLMQQLAAHIGEIPSMGLYSTASFLLILPLYFTPVVFARYNPIFSGQIPAKASELTTFTVLTSIPGTLAVMYISYYVCIGIAYICGFEGDIAGIFSNAALNQMEKVGLVMPEQWIVYFRSFSEALPAMASLAVITRANRNRVLWSFITPVIVTFAMGLITGIFSFILGFVHAINGIEPLDIEQLTLTLLIPVLIGAGIIGIAGIIVCTYIINRNFRTRQI